MPEHPRETLLHSWQTNAAAWTAVVREGRIAARREVTDRALLDAIQAWRPRRVLDLGCGEGWLGRWLQARGVDVLGLKNAQIYVGNQTEWIRTVQDATHYLEGVLQKDETFFAVPYEPLYYYLTDRRSPTWHVLMMIGSELNTTQEQQMINTLKDKRIRYVFLSNRYRSKEPDMGTLGETHLKDLAKYINDHFQTEVTFGLWEADPGWNFNHGLKILKRIE